MWLTHSNTIQDPGDRWHTMIPKGGYSYHCKEVYGSRVRSFRFEDLKLKMSSNRLYVPNVARSLFRHWRSCHRSEFERFWLEIGQLLTYRVMYLRLILECGFTRCPALGTDLSTMAWKYLQIPWRGPGNWLFTPETRWALRQLPRCLTSGRYDGHDGGSSQ